MKRITLLILAFASFMISSCDKDENEEPVEEFYMGTAYVGQSIPVDTKYSYSEGNYSTWISFIDQNSYNWSQTDVNGEMSMIVPCEYNTTTGEFSDSMIVTHNDQTMGAYHYFPTSFCIDSMNKMYPFYI